MAKVLGKRIFWAIPPLALVNSIMLIVSDTGLAYNMHVDSIIIILGVLFAQNKWRVVLLPLGVAAIVLSGSEEGLFVGGGLVLLWIAGKVYSRQFGQLRVLIVPGLVLIVVCAVISGLGMWDTIQPNLTKERFTNGIDVLFDKRVNGASDEWAAWQDSAYTAIGWDYVANKDSVHNTPLRIAMEIGILGGLAWLTLVLGGIRYTRYKLAFLAILGFSMIDHMFWTWLMPMLWLMLGVGTREEALCPVRAKPKPKQPIGAGSAKAYIAEVVR